MLKQTVTVILIAGAVMLVPEYSYADRDWSWGHGQFLQYESLDRKTLGLKPSLRSGRIGMPSSSPAIKGAPIVTKHVIRPQRPAQPAERHPGSVKAAAERLKFRKHWADLQRQQA